jgi:DNA-binding NarL/FixJ family response regulator
LDGEELLRRQILEDHVGSTAADVAVVLYCTPSKVRKIRGDALRDPETGVELLPIVGLPSGRADQAAHLMKLGYTQEQISRRLGVSQSTVSRLLEATRFRRNAA